MGFTSMIEDISERSNESVGMGSVRIEGRIRIHKPFVPKEKMLIANQPLPFSPPRVPSNRKQQTLKPVNNDFTYLNSRIAKFEKAIKETRYNARLLEQRLVEEKERTCKKNEQIRSLNIEIERLRELSGGY